MVTKEPAVPSGPIQPHPEVADAVRTGRAVVALESTILAHGVPRGDRPPRTSPVPVPGTS